MVGWGAIATSFGEEPARAEVEVTLFAVPEALWQARFEGRFHEDPALYLRLYGDAAAGRVEQPADFKFRLVGGDPVTQRKGADKDFAEGWRTWRGFNSPPVPEKQTHRFIGTSVELAQEPTSAPGALRLRVNLEHHLAEPAMKRFNYANAATGAERDRLAVEYPEFEKIEWQGKISVWREWRLVGNMLRPQPAVSPAMTAIRYLIFIKRV
ncbi:MAG TPA: hypothetical protein VD994_18505 [Prosthecobacter sp.]|nr:hypothetical protein [Prosthecobacter sp.]